MSINREEHACRVRTYLVEFAVVASEVLLDLVAARLAVLGEGDSLHVESFCAESRLKLSGLGGFSGAIRTIYNKERPVVSGAPDGSSTDFLGRFHAFSISVNACFGVWIL